METILRGKIKIISTYLGLEDGGWVKFKLNKPEEIIEYTHFPEDRILYIDRSDYAPDGFCNMSITERFRVEHIRGNIYWLYDLEGVETEPDDYYFKLKVRIFRT